MTRALKHDIPGTDWRVPLEALGEGGWKRVFRPELPHPRELVLDIGFGRGEFLLDLARTYPETAFLGVEYSHKRVLKLARRLARSELVNVRLVESTAERLVQEGLANASVACAWINFPDPWPKKRHHRRRLLNPAFVASLTDRIAPGGLVQVATDHAEYADVIDVALSAESRLENLFAPDAFRRDVPGRKPTAYEQEWRAQGRAFHFFAYRRSSPCAAEAS